MSLTLIVAFVVSGCEPPYRKIDIQIDSVTEVSYTSCLTKGSFLDFGEGDIVQHGFCYSLSLNPTVNDSTNNLGAKASGFSFSSSITGLSPNTTYFIKAFAYSSTDPVYSEEQRTFTTLALGKPIVETSPAKDISLTTAAVGGNVIANGGSSVSERGIWYGTTSNPELTGTNYQIGTGTGLYSKRLTELSVDTKYYVKAYASNIIGVSYGNEVSFDNSTHGTFTDSRDGIEYSWVRIGDHAWMNENLAYLPSVSPPTEESGISPYYYVFDQLDSNVSDALNRIDYQTYGALYNWPASLNACPAGWHLPADVEWKQLEMFLGMSQSVVDNTGWRGTDEGEKLKSVSGWYENGNGTDDYGFSAIPGGYRGIEGDFRNRGFYAGFWSATEYSSLRVLTWFLHSSKSDIALSYDNKEYGLSVRCVKD